MLPGFVSLRLWPASQVTGPGSLHYNPRYSTQEKKYRDKRLIMFDDIPWTAVQLQENKAALREYGWWPVGRLQFTTTKRQEHAPLDENIWVICLYQAMQSPMIAWGLRRSNVISQEGFKVSGNI